MRNVCLAQSEFCLKRTTNMFSWKTFENYFGTSQIWNIFLQGIYEEENDTQMQQRDPFARHSILS